MGCLFHFFFWGPLVITTGAMILIGTWNSGFMRLGQQILVLNGWGMLLCAIVCAVMMGRRHGVGWGIVAFLGTVVLYGAVTYAGCAALLQQLH